MDTLPLDPPALYAPAFVGANPSTRGEASPYAPAFVGANPSTRGEASPYASAFVGANPSTRGEASPYGPAFVGVNALSWHSRKTRVQSFQYEATPQGYTYSNLVLEPYRTLTPGIYARWKNGLTIGYLEANSQGHRSFLVAKTFEWGRWSLTAGGITGYAAMKVAPLLMGAVSFDLRKDWGFDVAEGTSVKLGFIPGVRVVQFGLVHPPVYTLHLMMEFPW